MSVMKNNSLSGFAGRMMLGLMLFSAALLSASSGDDCWVRRCYSWNGVGTMITGKIKLYGNDLRIRYASSSRGALRITLFDASAENPRPPQRVVDTQRLQHSGSRVFSGYKEVWLVIEGDEKNWIVEVDQYLTRIEEWRWMQDVKKNVPLLSPEAEWAGAETELIEYTPRVVPCRITFVNSGSGRVSLAVKNEDEKLFFSTLLDKQGASVESWLYEAGKYSFRVVCAESEWAVNVEAE